MQRKRFLAAAAAGLAGTSTAGIAIARGDGRDDSRALPLRRLRLPAGGRARVAFAIGQHVNVIDTARPWEVFQDVGAETGGSSPFDLVTVAETTDPVHATGGLTLVPHHAYDDCPQPNVIVVPAHHATTATREWLRRAAAEADVVMSVCTGAFVLAEAGLLDGRTATTHHGFSDSSSRASARWSSCAARASSSTTTSRRQRGHLGDRPGAPRGRALPRPTGRRRDGALPGAREPPLAHGLTRASAEAAVDSPHFRSSHR